MCGGGAPRQRQAVIAEPDYRAYDRLADAQLQTMQMAQSGPVLLAQQGVQAEAMRQQRVLTDLAAARTAAASNTSAAAARLAALIGAPPPEKAARAPVIGADRQGMTRPAGRKALRIDLQPPTTSLNIGV